MLSNAEVRGKGGRRRGRIQQFVGNGMPERMELEGFATLAFNSQ